MKRVCCMQLLLWPLCVLSHYQNCRTAVSCSVCITLSRYYNTTCIGDRCHHHHHHHHHHVQEELGLIPVPGILKMKLVPPSLPRSSYVSSSFGLYCSACLGILSLKTGPIQLREHTPTEKHAGLEASRWQPHH